MELYHYWLIAAFILLLIEVLSSGFAAVCIAIGGLFAALVAFLGFGVNVQIGVFLVVDILVFVFLRPFALKYVQRKQTLQTNGDAIIGRKATVSETIDARSNTGRVALDGDDWKAVSEDGSVIEEGESTEIIKIESITLTVKKN